MNFRITIKIVLAAYSYLIKRVNFEKRVNLNKKLCWNKKSLLCFKPSTEAKIFLVFVFVY